MRVALITWRPFMARILLDWVASRGHELVLLVTTQGRPTRRGDTWKSVLDLLPFDVPGVIVRHTSQAAALLESLKPDFIISYGFPLLIDEQTIAAARVAAINVHPGRLPDYRGANPTWAVYLGEPEIDITVHRLSSEFDTGDILGVTTLPVGNSPTPDQLEEMMSLHVGPTLDAAVTAALSGDVGLRQPETDCKTFTCFDPSDGELDWNLTTRMLMCRWSACAFTELPVTLPIAGTRRVVRGLLPIGGWSPSEPPGSILLSLDSNHIVTTLDGVVLIRIG